MATYKIFPTAFNIVEENQLFNSTELEIDLQECSRYGYTGILYSTNACSNVIDHIATEMRKKLVSKIKKPESKLFTLIDKLTMISNYIIIFV